jgi:hypothetical protein
MAAWASVLARAAGQHDVVFGAAFSGRPAELPGVEGMVGPCTTNLPVRVAVPDGTTPGALATSVRDRLFAASTHQHVSPLQVQDWSEVPWRDRLFESLIVFQNHEIGEAARSLGPQVRVDDFDGPVHGGYTLTLVATPQDGGLHLRLVHAAGRCSDARATDILAALKAFVHTDPDQVLPMGAIVWSTPTAERHPLGTTTARPPVAPRSPLERAIHAVWVRAFGPGVGVEENFFDAGGHSLIAFRVLAALRSELGLALSPADLFQFPTIAALARRLGDSTTAPAHPSTVPAAAASSTGGLDAVKARAARARQKLGQR